MGVGEQLQQHTGATPLRRVIVDVEAEALRGVDAEAIVDNLNPRTALARNLPFLAHAEGVTLWEDDWNEQTKREWLELQPRFKALVGTEDAIRMALAINGFQLVQVVKPSQGIFASPSLTVEENDAWVRRMPQIRWTVGPRQGVAAIDEWFVGLAHVGLDVIGLDDGPLLMTRTAVLRRNGVDLPLSSVVQISEGREVVTTEVQQVAVPGWSPDGFVVGDSAIGQDHVGADALEARTYTASFDRRYWHANDRLELSFIDPGLEAVPVRYERVAETGDGGPFWHAGVSHVGEDFVGDRDPAPDLLVDVVYLMDASITLPMTKGLSFVGVDRIGMRRNQVELLVELGTREPLGAWFAGESFVGEAFAVPEDDRARQKAMRAVDAARTLKQQMLISFETRVPIRFGDRITDATLAGEWAPERL